MENGIWVSKKSPVYLGNNLRAQWQRFGRISFSESWGGIFSQVDTGDGSNPEPKNISFLNKADTSHSFIDIDDMDDKQKLASSLRKANASILSKGLGKTICRYRNIQVAYD